MINIKPTLKFLTIAALATTVLGTASAADLPGRGKVIKAPDVGGLNFCQKPKGKMPESKIAQVAGGDIFGFTSATDVGNPGDCGIAFESTTRFGKDDGSYESATVKTQFSATIAKNVSTAFSFFTTQHEISNSTTLSNTGRIELDGLSGELSYRILERSANNPIAVTLSTEPRWNRIDALGGGYVTGYGNEFKIFADAVLIPEKLFGAVNVNYGLAGTKTRGAGSSFVKSSYINTSAALAYQISDVFLIGAEARLLTSYTGALLDTKAGHAVFVGPNFLYRVADNINLNVAWTPQVAGKADGVTGDNLDLTNFERHQVRAKMAVAF